MTPKKNLILPCLGGYDVNRHPSEILVTIDGDRLLDAETGEYLRVETQVGMDGQLKGWGRLDGPTYRVTADGGYGVDVPKAVIDSLGITVDVAK